MGNTKYCHECGENINLKAEICPKCGVRQADSPKPKSKPKPKVNSGENKDGVITLVLCLFFGYLGVHRFFSGHIGIGIVQLLTAGGCGIWTLIDLIMIAAGSYKDADGNIVKF